MTINTLNVSNSLKKLCVTQDGIAYFAPAFDLLAKLPECCNVSAVSSAICVELDAAMAGEFLSQMLTIECGSEGEIEGVEFTTDEINDCVALFHDICERFPSIVRIAQGG